MSHIKKGDTVVVLSGDDRGKEGVVLKIDRKKNRAVVEGVNFVKRHVRPTQKNPQGGIIEKEAPVHVSNLLPLGK
jgi:large subunit ribosomal protein L24